MILLGTKKRVKTVLQAQSSECGLACLTMIANYHGHAFDITYLRSLLPASKRGLSLAQIADLASTLGLDARGYATSSLDDLEKVALPCILHWEGNHFVVLEKIGRGGFTVHNPAFGRRILSADDMKEKFSGVVLEFEPRMNFTAVRNSGGNPLWPLLKATTGLRSAFAHLMILSLAVSVLALMMPILLQVALDVVLPQFDVDLLTVIVVGLGLFLVFEAVGRWLRDILVLRSAILFQTQFSRNVVGHAFRLPLKFFEQRHPGDFIARLDSVETVKLHLVNGLVVSIADTIMSVLIIALMFYYSAWMTLAVIATFVAVMLLRLGFLPSIRDRTTAALEQHSTERSRLLDGLREAATIKVHNAGPHVTGRWYESFARFANADFSAKRMETGVELLMHVILAIATVITLYMGVASVMQSTMSIGMLYAFFALRQMFFDRVDRLMTQLLHLSVLGVHLRRIDEIVEHKPEANSDGLQIDRTIRRSVKLDGVTVRFSGEDEPLLSRVDLSIDVEKGDSIAIIGQSGSGKSSLLRILSSVHDPAEGQVTVDDQPVAKFGLREYRAKIGAVFAEDGLFFGTVADNLSLFDPSISAETMQMAISAVGLDDVIDRLPQRLGTVVSEQSTLLSTGQRRRLLAARAICRRPRLYLFDEITANLDPATEQALIDRLIAIPGAKVFVTHAPALLGAVDRVYRVANGGLELVSVGIDGLESGRIGVLQPV